MFPQNQEIRLLFKTLIISIFFNFYPADLPTDYCSVEYFLSDYGPLSTDKKKTRALDFYLSSFLSIKTD